MRFLQSFILVVGFAVLTATPTWAQSAAKHLGAPACCAPSYGMLAYQQGCCEFTPSCCSQVWAGYCEMKTLRACHRWGVARPIGGWDGVGPCGCGPVSVNQYGGKASEAQGTYVESHQGGVTGGRIVPVQVSE